MGELKTFLEKSYNALKQWKSLREIHIVLGNESCDLDSTVSAIAYGFLLYKKAKLENSVDKAVFPVLNVERKHFPMHLEHCYLLKELDIDLKKLIYRSDIDFEEIIKENFVKTYLVDHHVLSQNDDILGPTVCRIFDHRSLDEKNVCPGKLRIEPVGSCVTIISDEIFKEGVEIWTKEIAYLVYCTILLDTKRLRPKKGKATALDVKIASKLEEKFGFNNKVYEKLKDLRCEICHLTPDQMLIKDLKCCGPIAFPRIHVLAENFIKMNDAIGSLQEFCCEKKASIIVLIGSEEHEDKKDLGVFFNCDNLDFMEKFSEKLRGAGLKDFPNQFEKFRVFKFQFRNMARKEILPIILEIYNEIKSMTPQ